MVAAVGAHRDDAIVDDAGWPEGRLINDPVFHDRAVDQLLADVPGLRIEGR